MKGLKFFKKGRVLVALSLFCSTGLFAQKQNVNKASSAIMNENWDKAVEFIDQAINNVETKLEAKTWYYKGRAYEGWIRGKNEITDTLISQMDEAANAYLKAIELDEEGGDYSVTSRDRLKGFNNLLLQKLAVPYSNQDYATSLKILNIVLKIDPSAQNYAYAGSCAYALEQYDMAYHHFEKAIEKGNTEENMYLNLLSLGYSLEKSYDEQQPYFAQAQSLYPQNTVFLHREIQTLERKESVDYHKVNDLYEKILAINSEDVVALFNLGIYYYNQGAKANKQNLAKPEIEEYFKEAQSYLERAYNANPEDPEIKKVLVKVYEILEMPDRIEALR